MHLCSHVCGIPVVAFNATGIEDIVEHKRSGDLVQSIDKSDFAQVVL